MIENYSPRVFDVGTISQAQHVILGAQGNVSMEQRWATETAYLIQLLEPFQFNEYSWLLDFGCGIGRVAKAVIARWNCCVVGVDISPSMLALARHYVDSPKFTALPVNQIGDYCFDAAIACWVLQHVNFPDADIKRIVKGWIDRAFDHKMLLRHDDPLVKPLQQLGEPVYICDSNPTVEHIAQLIYRHAAQEGLPVVRVKVWETPTSYAEYGE